MLGDVRLGAESAKVVRPVDEALRRRIRDTVEHYRVLARRHRAGDFTRVQAL